MKRLSHFTAILAATLAVGTISHAAAADPIKIGILDTTSGPYAIWGNSFEQAIEYYLDQHNGKDGNPQVEIIYRDVGGDNPPRARQLAQELVVNDNVAILGGLEFTTTALAMPDVANQAKIPFVAFNTATSIVTDKSPYIVRAGFTQWQSVYPLGQWAAAQGYKSCEMFIADYAPGQDAIDSFSYAFTHSGSGKMLDPIRVPMNTTDFSTYFQHVYDNKPDCLVAFMPGGPMSAATLKGFAERGFYKAGMHLLGTVGAEFDLPVVGDAAIGDINAAIYGPNLDNPENKAFVAGMEKKYPGNEMIDGTPSFIHVEAYDGMEMLFRMLKATGGKRDGDKMIAAIKGASWNSPRGPVKVDPDTRELIQNVYIREVKNVDGKPLNVVIKTYPAENDMWHVLHIGAKAGK